MHLLRDALLDARDRPRVTFPVPGDLKGESVPSPARVVIGIGNRFRQDDAVGLIIAQRIRALVPSSVLVIEHDGDPLDLLPVWSGRDLAILIDALHAPEEAGKIRRFNPGVDLPPNREAIISSHGHSLWDALELANVLGKRPQHSVIFTITGRQFGYGETLSPEVEDAIDDAVPRILAALDEYE